MVDVISGKSARTKICTVEIYRSNVRRRSKKKK